VGLRVQKKEKLAVKDFRRIERALFEKAYPAEYDRELGWIPKAGVNGDNNIWGTAVTITRDGVRSNGEKSAADLPASKPILAVGDSFTFGDTVSDSETWPAILESMLKRPVINGGVFGYGLDQSYLRARRLIKKYNPDILIFSFIPDNVNRCQLSRRNGTDKPYFDVVNDKPVLKNVPIRPPSNTMETDRFREIGGYSFLVHRVMSKLKPEYWLVKKKDDWRANRSTLTAGRSRACY